MTGLLDAYGGLMESVTWKSRSSTDQYGDVTFTDSTISVIWFDDIRMVRDEQGEKLEQYATIQTTSAVLQGDSITRGGLTWPIIGIKKTPTFEGEQFRIAILGKGA